MEKEKKLLKVCQGDLVLWVNNKKLIKVYKGERLIYDKEKGISENVKIVKQDNGENKVD